MQLNGWQDGVFSLNFPLQRTHLGLPLANGNLGVLIWGEGNVLRLTVNRADHWDHRFGELIQPGQNYHDMASAFDPMNVITTQERFVRKTFPLDKDIYWRSTRMPAGRFELELADGEILESITLDYCSGMATVQCRSGKQIRILIVRRCCQLLIDDKERLVKKVRPLPAWEFVGEIFEKAEIEKPQILNEEDACGWFQPLPQDDGFRAVCRRIESALAVSVELQSEPDWDFCAEDFDASFSANQEYWNSFWQRSPKIDLPDDFLNAFFKFALYKFSCATDPTGIACSLQGPWVEEYRKTQWNGDYHFNVNVQQTYTLAFSINGFEHLLPLFDMLESDSFSDSVRQNARNLLGIDDGILLTHAMDDLGLQCGGITTTAAFDFACSGWTAQLYWLYYRHTLDREFLEKRALPFMRGVMNVFIAAMEEYDGRLSIPVGVSAEYGCTFPLLKNGKMIRQNCGRDSSNQLMCAHMLADALLEASNVLGKEPDGSWLDVKKRLPMYTTGGDRDSERIFLWEGQDLDISHRHHSHLAGIYPFANLDVLDEKEKSIVNNTIEHWISTGMGLWSEWCFPWAAIIQSRLGFSEAPYELLKIWRRLYLNSSWVTVYQPNFPGISSHRLKLDQQQGEQSEVMQLDGTMGAATAILEMLVYRKNDTVFLFSGIPESWQNLSFENISLAGGILISAEIKDGKLLRVEISGEESLNVKISFRGKLVDMHELR